MKQMNRLRTAAATKTTTTTTQLLRICGSTLVSLLTLTLGAARCGAPLGCPLRRCLPAHARPSSPAAAAAGAAASARGGGGGGPKAAPRRRPGGPCSRRRGTRRRGGAGGKGQSSDELQRNREEMYQFDIFRVGEQWDFELAKNLTVHVSRPLE